MYKYAILVRMNILFTLLRACHSVLAYEPGSIQLTSVEPGADLTLAQIVVNVITMFSSTIVYVASAVFVYGAFLYITSAVKEENKSSGQQYMTGAIIGLLIVYSAQGIFNLVIAFIYTPT
jgi:hypothetical protein